MEHKWTYVIKPKTQLFDFQLRELWKYRDLIWLFVKRDFNTRFKQTILGPTWFIIQPLFTAGMQAFVFGDVANMELPVSGVSHFLFYMVGNMPWMYFSTCLTSTSNTFVQNANVFGKVYFPRLSIPISAVISSMVNFGVQILLVILFSLLFLFRGSNAHLTWAVLLTPILVTQMAMLGLGFGIIISSMTTKYRDLQVMVSFGVQLWMYATPVIYASSTLSKGWHTLIMLNPMSPIVEFMRYGWIGVGETPFLFWGISWITTLIVLLIGITMFNKVEKTFMDTV